MKKLFLALSAAVLCSAVLLAKGDKDPVVMTVNKKPVTLSEFEYLYQKNNAQQATVQPVDEYLDLFVTYKLKVAAAEAEGIDQTEAFQNEYAGYVRDLSEPYLSDAAARDSLVNLIYNRLGEEVRVSHVMIALGKTPAEVQQQKQLLDSLRTEILAGRANFEDVARKYSIDPSVSRNGGDQGYVSSGMYPYTFEDAAYETPVGEISDIIETPFGYHIVKVTDRRETLGQVKVQHILKLTQGLTEEDQALKKAEIDSIYTLLVNGADFDALAMAESEDPGSARQGGNLDWFGAGRMVPEFEKVSFELANGELSQPFQTAYGWHIVKRLDWKGVDPFEELAPKISAFIDRDERQFIPQRAKKQQLRAKYQATVNEKLLNTIKSEITAAGVLDSAMIANYSADKRQIISLKGKNAGATVGNVFEVLPIRSNAIAPELAMEILNNRINEVIDETVTNAERSNLATENAEYRNLLNEYRDGMLLFEISDRNVWSKSKNDAEGLNQFFEENRAKYTNWTAPKFKGYVVFATSDSIIGLAQNYLDTNAPAGSDVAEALRKEFGRDIKVERVLAAQGENAIIDGLAFGAVMPELTGKWAACIAYAGKIVDQPEEPADCRGEVTTDYQAYLEKQWVDQLRKTYPVKINNKVLDQLK